MQVYSILLPLVLTARPTPGQRCTYNVCAIITLQPYHKEWDMKVLTFGLELAMGTMREGVEEGCPLNPF